LSFQALGDRCDDVLAQALRILRKAGDYRFKRLLAVSHDLDKILLDVAHVVFGFRQPVALAVCGLYQSGVKFLGLVADIVLGLGNRSGLPVDRFA
jgi:hypothetical protein